MFFDEITRTLGEDISAIKNFSLVNVANHGLLVNGHNQVVMCTTCKIVLKCNKNNIYIYGQNLSIVSMSNTDFVIKGNIWCVSDREVVLC